MSSGTSDTSQSRLVLQIGISVSLSKGVTVVNMDKERVFQNAFEQFGEQHWSAEVSGRSARYFFDAAWNAAYGVGFADGVVAGQKQQAAVLEKVMDSMTASAKSVQENNDEGA